MSDTGEPPDTTLNTGRPYVRRRLVVEITLVLKPAQAPVLPEDVETGVTTTEDGAW